MPGENAGATTTGGFDFFLTGVLNRVAINASSSVCFSKGKSRLGAGEREGDRSGTLVASGGLVRSGVGVGISLIVFVPLLVNTPLLFFACDGVAMISLPFSSSSPMLLHRFNFLPTPSSSPPLALLFTCLADFPHGFLITGPRILAEWRYRGSPRR